MMYFEIDFPRSIYFLRENREVQNIGGLTSHCSKLLSNIYLPRGGIDIGCGTGDLSIEISQTHKIPMLGIDISEDLILKAVNGAAERNVDCTFICDDVFRYLESFPEHLTFGVVLAMATGDIYGDPASTFNLLKSLVGTSGVLALGWISEESTSLSEMKSLEAELQNDRRFKIKSTISTLHFFDFYEEVARTDKIIAQDIRYLSAGDAAVLERWYSSRIADMHKSHGSVSRKTVCIIEKIL